MQAPYTLNMMTLLVVFLVDCTRRGANNARASCDNPRLESQFREFARDGFGVRVARKSKNSIIRLFVCFSVCLVSFPEKLANLIHTRIRIMHKVIFNPNTAQDSCAAGDAGHCRRTHARRINSTTESKQIIPRQPDLHRKFVISLIRW